MVMWCAMCSCVSRTSIAICDPSVFLHTQVCVCVCACHSCGPQSLSAPQDFYAPFNAKLAALMGDNRFLWTPVADDGSSSGTQQMQQQQPQQQPFQQQFPQQGQHFSQQAGMGGGGMMNSGAAMNGGSSSAGASTNTGYSMPFTQGGEGAGAAFLQGIAADQQRQQQQQQTLPARRMLRQ